MNYELRLSAVHSLSDNVYQGIEPTVGVGNRRLRLFLRFREFHQYVSQTLISLASSAPLSTPGPNH